MLLGRAAPKAFSWPAPDSPGQTACAVARCSWTNLYSTLSGSETGFSARQSHQTAHADVVNLPKCLSWLFAGSERAGKRAVAIQSLIGTARLISIDPAQWLRDTLEKLPTWPNSRIDELLPVRWTGNH